MRGGRGQSLSMYCCKILELINKLMKFFMNRGLISFNTAPTPQNIFLMLIDKHILIIRNVLEKLSSNSPFVKVLHQQIRVGIKACADLADTGNWGVQDFGKHADVILECSLSIGIQCPV